MEEGACEAFVIWLVSKGADQFAKLVQLLRGQTKTDPIWNEVYEYPVIEDMEKAFKVWVLSEW